MTESASYSSAPITDAYINQVTAFYSSSIAQHPVYENNREQIFVAALANNFPVSSMAMGASNFKSICYAFVRYQFKIQTSDFNEANNKADDEVDNEVSNEVNKDWDINLFGDYFPSFIKAQANNPHSDIDWKTISWLAALEYKLLQLYYADQTSKQQLLEISHQASSDIDPTLLHNRFDQLSDCHRWLTVDIATTKIIDTEFTLSATRRLSSAGFESVLTLKQD